MLFLKTWILLLLYLPSILISVEEKTVVRVGHFPNVTHAQAVIGHGLSRKQQGWFEKRLGPHVKVDWYVYKDGPSAMEAIFADSIDLAYSGPTPTINAYLKSEGKEIRVVCGSCSGGAALVVQPHLIKTIEDFKGKIIATPQIGNTQDIAARTWFRSKGFKFNLFGGDIKILPMGNSDQLALFQQKDLTGAWNIEPWVSQLVLEGKGEVYMKESALWTSTGGQYVTTHLVSSVKFLTRQADLLRKWVLAHVELTRWITENPDKAKEIFNEEFKQEAWRSLPQNILDRAWSQLEFTIDPIKPSLFKYAEDAYQLGSFKTPPNLDQLYELKFLEEVLRSKNEKGNNN